MGINSPVYVVGFFSKELPLIKWYYIQLHSLLGNIEIMASTDIKDPQQQNVSIKVDNQNIIEGNLSIPLSIRISKELLYLLMEVGAVAIVPEIDMLLRF